LSALNYFLLGVGAGFIITFGQQKSVLIQSHPTPVNNVHRTYFKTLQTAGVVLLVFAIFSYYGDHKVFISVLKWVSQTKREFRLPSSIDAEQPVLLDYVRLLFGGLAPILGLALGVFIARVLLFRFESANTSGAGLRDISEMDQLFKSMRSFDPLAYIDVNQGVFVGLQSPQSDRNYLGLKFDQHQGKPIYVPWNLFKETHAQVLGSTGSGKGIALGVLGFQFALRKESLIVFDPKGDARLPLVLAQGASTSGAEFVYIDLQAHSKAQFNLLEGANEFEIEELLVAGLGLQPSSGEGNYYRGIDQDAAEQVSKRAINDMLIHSVTLPRLLEIAQLSKQISKADNFVRRLRQVCELRVIQTSFGIGFLDHIKKGSVIYIRGSTDNHRVKMLQTMLLIRILQVVKTRVAVNLIHKSDELRPVCLILDEFKHLLSPVALDMLGVVRELGCHALLAHQSLADLAACPGLERKDVEPVVVDNASLKLIFRIGDDEAARGFANKSGQERTYKESIKPVQGTLDSARSWNEVQHPRMSSDLFLHLHRPSEAPAPFTAGVLFGLGLAKLFSLSPITAKGALAPPREAPLSSRAAVISVEDLI